LAAIAASGGRPDIPLACRMCVPEPTAVRRVYGGE
jgi:hypothetical protein